MNLYQYSDSNKRYYTLDYFYKQKFGCKVAKISLNGNFTCPNIDGTVGFGGCIFCSKLGSGDFAGKKEDSLEKQFNDIKTIIDKKWHNTKYIAYFQANTNTYAPINILKQKYETVLKFDNVIGLSIATRADSITLECLDYLENLAKRTYLTIELGLQTIHEKTSKLINRGHDLETFDKMVKKLRSKNINVVVHIINGLPYETKEMMIETVKHLNKLDIQGIKIHMLHILKNTQLAKLYNIKPFKVLTKEEYIDIVVCQLENLNSNIVINRITGDPNIDDLIEPNWLTKKLTVLNDIDKLLAKRNTYQGFNLSILNKVKQIMSENIKLNDIVIDTNYDNLDNSLFLSKLSNKVYTFDIQNNTKKLVQNITVINDCYSNISNYFKENTVTLINFNLGYLSDKTIKTNYKTTIKAIKNGLTLLNMKGIILITIYSYYEESTEIKKYLNKNKIVYHKYHNTCNSKDPYLIEIKKKEN